MPAQKKSSDTPATASVIPPDQLAPIALRTPQASAYVGVPAETLKRWRTEGRGPRYIRLEGQIVAYRVADLNHWIESAG